MSDIELEGEDPIVEAPPDEDHDDTAAEHGLTAPEPSDDDDDDDADGDD